MRKLNVVMALCCCLFANNLFAKSAVQIHQWHTRNDVRVLFVQATQVPILDIAAVFKAGSVYDGKHKGLASLTNGMLNEGAGPYSVNELAVQFDKLGAQFSNRVSEEMSIVSLRTLTQPSVLQAALKTFSLILTQPTFPQDSVSRLKKQMLISLKVSQQQPSYIAAREFAKLIWGTHPYANPIGGTVGTIPTLSQTMARNFYQKYYVAKNAMLVLVGNVSIVQAHAIAEQLLGHLPVGRAAAKIPLVINNKPKTQHIILPASQNAILMGEVAVKRNNPDYFPLLVGNYILGGQGLSSILMRTIREKYGLTYGVYSQFISFSQRGAFVISLNSRNDQALRASKLTQNYLKKYLITGPTAAQLKAAKAFLVGDFPLTISSNSALLRKLITMGYYQLPLDFLDTYPEKIKAVTLTQIKNAFDRHLQFKRLVVISAGGKLKLHKKIP